MLSPPIQFPAPSLWQLLLKRWRRRSERPAWTDDPLSDHTAVAVGPALWINRTLTPAAAAIPATPDTRHQPPTWRPQVTSSPGKDRASAIPHLRLPRGLSPAEIAPPDTLSAAQLAADRDTLFGIAAGLDRLEQRVDRTRILTTATNRGYFTPDQDDRLRQALLAYRNYRLGAYEIILRHRNYEKVEDRSLQLRSFLVAFGAALLLYAKSLKIIQLFEHTPAARAKFNEPEPKYELEAGFFDDVVMGYSSLSNFRALVRGDRFWRAHRRSAFQLGLAADPDWAWLHQLICCKRQLVRRRLFRVLLQRLRYDWHAFWRSVLWPARRTRYGLQTLLGGRFAGIHVVPNAAPALSPAMLADLRPLLQPGDVLLCRAESKLTAALLPGFWSHAAIFLGSRQELAALDPASAHGAQLWPNVPDQPESLGVVIEAVSPRVRVAPLELTLRADHVVVLRPNLPPRQIGAGLREALRHLGKPYDYEFDFNYPGRIVCTELVYRSYHRRGSCLFPLVKRLGRFTLTGDDIVALALDALARAPHLPAATVPFQPIALRLLRRNGCVQAVPADRIIPLLRRIRHGWRPARRVTPSRQNSISP